MAGQLILMSFEGRACDGNEAWQGELYSQTKVSGKDVDSVLTDVKPPHREFKWGGV